MKPIENPLVVFVSSGQRELASERKLCAEVINSLVLTRPWLFEYTPASADSRDASYLKKVEECDIFVALVGRAPSAGAQKEWERAVQAGKRRLVLVQEASGRSPEVHEWLREVDVKYDQFSGPDELRERLLAALVDELIKGYREFRLQKEDYRRIFKTIRSMNVTFSVRTIDGSEIDDIRSAFPELRQLYPEVDAWFDAKIPAVGRGEAAASLATYGTHKAGVALTSDKAAGVRKLSTLFILPRFQGVGVGPRLLYAVIIKAAEEGVEKLYITAAEERRAELEKLLLRYGFQVEGVSPRRYRDRSSEWVWGKQLLSGLLLKEDLHAFVRRYLFVDRGFGIEAVGNCSFIAESRSDVIGRADSVRTRCLVVTADEEEEDRYRNAVGSADALGLPLVFVGLERVRSPRPGDVCLDALDLEILFFPLIVERRIDGLLIPIRERFAAHLIPSTKMQQLFPPDRVQLRTDNVYYRAPTDYQGLRRGAPLFFYATERGSARSGLVGVAKLLDWAVDEPRELFAEFGNLGVYSLEHLLERAPKKGRDAGKILALKFDWYQELRTELDFAAIRAIVPRFNPITMRRIDFGTTCEIRRAAGWPVTPLSFR